MISLAGRSRFVAMTGVVVVTLLGTTTRQHAKTRPPESVVVLRDLVYGLDADERLDLYVPKVVANTGRALPTVVWIHGGGWVGGDKHDLARYAGALASTGFAVAAIDYTLPPKAIYPTPVLQAFEALAYLRREAAQLHVDPARFVLAGDSAGAQIAAQVATVATSGAYARQLRIAPTIPAKSLKGVMLFSGAYDLDTMKFDGPITSKLGGPLAAYAGTGRFRADPAFATFSVARYVTAAFPPTFISAGNADDLESQSRAFAARLKKLGVRVDSLFFDRNYRPRLPHDYQFEMKPAASRLALWRIFRFVARVVATR